MNLHSYKTNLPEMGITRIQDLEMNRIATTTTRGIARSLLIALTALLIGGLGTAGAQAVKVDKQLPVYKKSGFTSGNLDSIGSDTLNNLMTLWSENFRRIYPSVVIQIEGKGSSTAPPALIKGTAKLGPMSRKMKSKEINAFEKKFGYKPTAIGVALDSLAVYVHKDNPIQAISLQEVDAIFSKNRKGGLTKKIETWGQAGLNGSWANKPISLYGRNSASGTYGYFKKKALFKGDYKDTVKEQPGSASVVQGVASDRGAIGYSGIGYATSGVRAVPLARKPGDAPHEPTYANALSGKYPLARPLLIYVNKHPTKGLDKLTREFLKLVLSKEGQQIVIKDGYLPLPAAVAGQERAKL